MKTLTILVALAVVGVIHNLSAQSLEQTKLAADAGDPAAQDKLADSFLLRGDRTQAEFWYRKAAAGGYARAQGQLGTLLLPPIATRKRAAVETLAKIDEAVRWVTIAANQGDRGEQEVLAGLYLEGRVVDQDLVEAYKWAELSTRVIGTNGVVSSGISRTRDAAVLEMNAEQIAEARDRVAAFSVQTIQPSDLPKPAWVQQIRLNGIAGRRFATIGKDTYAKGERGTVKINGKPVNIQCLEITESSTVISVDGIDGPVTLTLR